MTEHQNKCNKFFPFCVSKWYEKDNFVRKAGNIKRFKFMLMEFLNLKQRSLFVIHNTPGFKLLTMPELRISPANICWS